MAGDWSRLRSFYYAALCGSFTSAAKQLFVTQPSISRQIASLEEGLGVMLFHRTSRGLMLTEQGKMLFKAVQRMKSVYEMAESELKDNSDTITGTFRLAVASHLMSTNYLLKILSRFTAANPKVKLALHPTNNNDGWVPGADAAIAPANNITDNLNYDHLLSLKPSIWASKRYYEYMEKSNNLNDLSKYHLIAYLADLPYSRLYNWHVYNNDNPTNNTDSKEKGVSLWLSNVDEAIGAVTQGFGIGSFPEVFIPDNIKTDLKRLNNPNRGGPVVDLYYIYPMENASSKRVRIMSMFLRQILDEIFGHDPRRNLNKFTK